MEEKKTNWNKNSIWSIFGNWNNIGAFFRRSNNTDSYAFHVPNLKHQKGFTLIELLIVIAIIGILAAGITTIINPLTQFEKARDAGRKSDLSQIQKALEIYYNDNNRYPDTTDFNPWPVSFASYMTSVPQDPRSPTLVYDYFATPDRQTYYLYASLERGANDQQACTAIPCTNALANGLVCGGDCNYGATSPNTTP